MTFFQDLEKSLKVNGRASIAITRTEKGLAVTILSQKVSKDGTAEESKIKPLIFTGTAQEIDEVFFSKITTIVEQGQNALFPNEKEVQESITAEEKSNEKKTAKTKSKNTELEKKEVKANPEKEYVDQLKEALKLRNKEALTEVITQATTKIKLYPKQKKVIEGLINELKTIKLKLDNGMFDDEKTKTKESVKVEPAAVVVQSAMNNDDDTEELPDFAETEDLDKEEEELTPQIEEPADQPDDDDDLFKD